MIKVLLVDDQPAVRRGLRMRLGLEADISVVGEAGDGKTALEAAQALRPEVVVMDIEMPNMDGIAATAALKALYPRAVVIVLSIHDDEETRRRALEAGATAFIAKSANASVLLQTIRETIEKWKKEEL